MKKQEPIQSVVAYASSNILGEGPVWHDERQSLLWVDIEGQFIHELKWPGKEVEMWQMPQRIGMLAVENKNEVMVALQHGLAKFNLETKELEWVSEIEKDINTNRPNDGKCDVKGRLWLGTMDLECNKDSGSLYCIEKDLSVTQKLTGLTISNGLAWSLDGKRLYFIDSSTYKIECYLFNADMGTIAFEKTVINVPVNMGMPDGMTIDEEGMLWIAHWNGFAVYRWNPYTGGLLDKIPLPVPQVTSCTFGGENLDVLFITTAKVGLNEEQLLQYPLSGHVFVAQPGVKGSVANKFGSINTKI